MALHVLPEGDARDHDLHSGCWCGPNVVTLQRPDGRYGLLVEHIPAIVGPAPNPDGTDSITP